MAECLDCQLSYSQFGVDLVLPDQQWIIIFPEQSGILCPNCICLRATKHGATSVVGWLSNLNYETEKEPTP